MAPRISRATPYHDFDAALHALGFTATRPIFIYQDAMHIFLYASTERRSAGMTLPGAGACCRQSIFDAFRDIDDALYHCNSRPCMTPM